jgi:outer membrane protein assembly factor BamA
LRYNFDNVRLSNIKVSSEIARADTPRNLSTISTTYINDTRDDYLDPMKGFFTSTDLGLTTNILGGNNNFLSLYAQNSYFKKYAKSLQTAVSFRFGVLQPFGGDNVIPISERFFAGGGSSLRGFETDFAGPLDPITHNPVGGNVLLIGNYEVRLPLIKPVYWAGFYDVGNVFRDFSDISLSGISHTIGFGLRIKTPFGPLRADYGYNLNLSPELRMSGHHPGHFFITIGPPF